MCNRLVYLVDSGSKALICQPHIATESVLERHQFLFKIGYVHLLRLHDCQLALGVQTLLVRLAKKRNNRHKELRTNDVHLLIPVAHIHDAAVVELAVRLQH